MMYGAEAVPFPPVTPLAAVNPELLLMMMAL